MAKSKNTKKSNKETLTVKQVFSRIEENAQEIISDSVETVCQDFIDDYDLDGKLLSGLVDLVKGEAFNAVQVCLDGVSDQVDIVHNALMVEKEKADKRDGNSEVAIISQFEDLADKLRSISSPYTLFAVKKILGDVLK